MHVRLPLHGRQEYPARLWEGGVLRPQSTGGRNLHLPMLPKDTRKRHRASQGTRHTSLTGSIVFKAHSDTGNITIQYVIQ